MGVVGLVDFEFSGGARRVGRALGARAADLLRIRHGDVRRHPRRRHRRRPAHRRPAARLRRPRHDGPAEDHQRRLAEHPHGLVLRAVRRRAPPGVPLRPAQPLRRRAARRCSPARTARGLEVATHAIGDAAVAEALAAYADTGARGSIEHAQLVGRDDVRRMAELGIRASVQPAHLLDDRDLTEQIWAGPGRALLRVPLDARRRRRAGARLRRPGLAARPVAGDRGGRAPQRRRARARGTPSRRSPRARRSPPRSTASRRSASGSRGDLVLLDADPLAAGGTRRPPARCCAPCRSPPPSSAASRCTTCGSARGSAPGQPRGRLTRPRAR